MAESLEKTLSNSRDAIRFSSRSDPKFLFVSFVSFVVNGFYKIRQSEAIPYSRGATRFSRSDPSIFLIRANSL